MGLNVLYVVGGVFVFKRLLGGLLPLKMYEKEELGDGKKRY